MNDPVRVRIPQGQLDLSTFVSAMWSFSYPEENFRRHFLGFPGESTIGRVEDENLPHKVDVIAGQEAVALVWPRPEDSIKPFYFKLIGDGLKDELVSAELS